MSEPKEYNRLRAKAIQALARREYSVSELTDKLLGLSKQQRTVHELIANLVNDDYVSDSRFAEILCRSRFNRGVGPAQA